MTIKATLKMTLSHTGTPWAEEYRGSGRLTGQLAAKPAVMENGNVAPGWRYVGDMTEDEFGEVFEEEEARYLGA